MWFLTVCRLQLARAAVPTVSVGNLTFSDEDLDAAEVGGTVAWDPPVTTVDVTGYTVGVATDTTGSNFISLGVTSIGTNELAAGPNVDVSSSSYTHAVVYTRNSDGLQAMPAAVSFTDEVASVTNLQFVDDDLDIAEIGGDVSWFAPGSSAVESYYVYVATNGNGGARALVGTSDIPFGTNELGMPQDSPINLYGYVLVYTASTLAEQSSPVSVEFADTSSSVTNLVFHDKDLDADQIGGSATWILPSDTTRVAAYQIYWAEDATGMVEALITSLPPVSTNYDVNPDTAITTKTYVLVYTSSLARQSTPAAVDIVNRDSSVTILAFADTDLDPSEVGGSITWTAPPDVTQVTHYSVYLAQSGAGALRSQLGADIAVATTLPTMPMDSSIGLNTHIVVYTKSTLCEQSTPEGLQIQDFFGGVSFISFDDEDLDGAEIGGTVTWTPPTDILTVTEFKVYFATSQTGAGNSQIGSPIAVNANVISIPADTDIGDYSHVVVYSESADAVQTTPSYLALSDTEASVSAAEFRDFDLDENEVEGTVKWSSPGDDDKITSYQVYFSEDPVGGNRTQVGSDLPYGYAGTNQVDVPVDTALKDFTHLAIYTRSALAEQSTPFSLLVSDANQGALNVSFVDLDLDENDLGGDMSWLEPAEHTEVTHYAAYLASDNAGTNKQLLGLQPLGFQVGTTEFEVPADTKKESFTHVVVFTRSQKGLQTTPSSNVVVDNSVTVPGIFLDDLDLDTFHIAGELRWDEATDMTLVTHYKLYLSTDPTNAASASQIGNTVAGGTNTMTLLADTSRGLNTYFTIHVLSSFVEQGSPAGFALIEDRDSTVKDLTFGDRDFGSGQIGGIVHWDEPTDASKVVNYAVYLAEDDAGTGKNQVENTLDVGTNFVTMPINTALSPFTHIIVYSKSTLGVFQTTPAAVVIADTPDINVNTRWTIENGEATTPLQDGKWYTPEVGQEWIIKELVFYADSGCTSEISSGTRVSSGQKGKFFGSERAFDGEIDTEWHAQCAPCSAGEAYIGKVVASMVKCVRWVQPNVLSGSGTRTVVFAIGGVELSRVQNLRGGQWEGIRYIDGPGNGGQWRRL